MMSQAHASHKTIDNRLIDLLACPLTKAPLSYDAQAKELISPDSNLAFPIRDGIPIMLADEARNTDKAQAPLSSAESGPAGRDSYYDRVTKL